MWFAYQCIAADVLQYIDIVQGQVRVRNAWMRSLLWSCHSSVAITLLVGKVVPCNSWLTGMVNKRSNHTVVYCMILVLKLTSVVELRFRRPPLFKRLLQLWLAIQLSWKAHKDSGCTAMIAIMHWRLRAKTSPWWHSCEHCNSTSIYCNMSWCFDICTYLSVLRYVDMLLQL